MKISIITVCYNSESTIRDTIVSVLNQSYRNIEYIIVDGKSTDSTLSIINEYIDNVDFFVSEHDLGLYDAMNKGVKLATGDFIGILNSDDLFFSENSISDLVDYLDKNESLDAVYADLIYVDQNLTNKKTRDYSLRNYKLWKVRFGFMIPHPTFYVKKRFFNELGFYRTDFRVASDFELMLRFLLAGIVISRCPLILVKMREGGISNTGLKWIVHQNFEILRACRENKFYTNIVFLSFKIPFKIAAKFL